LSDAAALAGAVQELDALQHLYLGELEDHCLEDRDEAVLEVLLTNKPNLRSFGIAALLNWQLELFGRSGRGSVTDRSIEIIVGKVGSTIQELNLENQTRVTAAGLETILRGCPLLRKLTIIGSHF